MTDLANSIDPVSKTAKRGCTSIHAATKTGEPKARKILRRALILQDGLLAFLQALPALKPTDK